MLNDVVTDACNMKQNNAFNFKHCQDNQIRMAITVSAWLITAEATDLQVFV